jgi:hypothetical protein
MLAPYPLGAVYEFVRSTPCLASTSAKEALRAIQAALPRGPAVHGLRLILGQPACQAMPHFANVLLGDLDHAGAAAGRAQILDGSVPSSRTTRMQNQPRGSFRDHVGTSAQVTAAAVADTHDFRIDPKDRRDPAASLGTPLSAALACTAAACAQRQRVNVAAGALALRQRPRHTGPTICVGATRPVVPPEERA